MPPRETMNCDAEMSAGISGKAEGDIVRKRVNDTGLRMHSYRPAGKCNAVAVSSGEIPWRTSRRLQEATLRLIKGRDGGQLRSQVIVKEETYSGSGDSLQPTCSPKRRQWESDPRGDRQEDNLYEGAGDDSTGKPSVAEGERTAWGTETAATSLTLCSKVKRRRKAQLSEPLRLLTEDEKRNVQLNDTCLLFTKDENKSVTSTSSEANEDDGDKVIDHISTPAAARKGVSGKKVEPRTIAGSGTNGVKLPQSCFDLHCSHVGFRGWRCYRSRTVGQVFCVYHRRESTPVAGICLYI